MARRLCRLEDLPEEGSRRLDFPADDHVHGLCVVRRQGRIHAYLNRCPHMGSPMDWQPGEFLDRSGEYIVCAMHGAHFRVEDGYCVAGPCRGQFLQAVELTAQDGELVMPELPLVPTGG